MERRVDVVVYKVDRLGDWLFAEASIAQIIEATQRRGGRCVIWASRETTGLRHWRPAACPVETFPFEPRGWRARLARTCAVIRLLATYRCGAFYCLRHGPDPVRDFVLKNIAAINIHALTWRISPGELERVPHEIRRHFWILEGAGLAPAEPHELLPRLRAPPCKPAGPVILAPFSSAPIKDWTSAGWCAVVQAFSDHAQHWELWVGLDQLARARELAEQLSQAADRDVTVSVHSGNLIELAEAIASACIVVAVDTLAAHLAVSLDVRMVGILGGGHYGDFAPWSRSHRQRWVTHQLPCYNCGWECTRPQPDCVQLITPEKVVSAMRCVWDIEDGDAPLEPPPTGQDDGSCRSDESAHSVATGGR